MSHSRYHGCPTAEELNKGDLSGSPSSILNNLISRLELAELLRITPRSLDRWVWQRKGPRRFKIGNKAYYDVAEVDAWLERQKEKGLGEANR